MYQLKLYLVGLIIIGFFSACDQSFCRDCATFDTDISSWRESNETINENIIFLGNNETIHLRLNETGTNEPYEECAVGESIDLVTCATNKEFYYTFAELLISYSEEFKTVQNAQQNNTVATYSFGWLGNDTIYQTIINDINNEPELLMQFEELALFEAQGVSYTEVLRMEIDEVRNLSTNGIEAPSIIKALYFKPGIGLVGFTENNDLTYIRNK